MVNSSVIYICVSLVVVILVLVLIKLYLTLVSGWCKSNTCLLGKTAIVTGANSGIGYQAAEDFAKRGARVILACRNETRGMDAVERIKMATDNHNIVYKNLDLSSLKSVREFAEDINRTEERLDILLNNAGIAQPGSNKTEDGLDLVTASNYFGPFLLTNLLLDLLKKTLNSRVVNVSSLAARLSKRIDLNKLNDYPECEIFGKFNIYARSKACNILFTVELAQRLKGTSVTTYSLHPGGVKTELARSIYKALSPVHEFVFYKIINWFLKSPQEGAQTSIYCSVAKGIEAMSGEYFVDCRFCSRYGNLQDADLLKKLWDVTANLVNLN